MLSTDKISLFCSRWVSDFSKSFGDKSVGLGSCRTVPFKNVILIRS